MFWWNVSLLGALLLPVLALPSQISQLSGEGDYRFVTLHWQYPSPPTAPPGGISGFQINYCELQAWGPNRCRSKFLDATSGVPYMGDPEFRVYTIVVSGLRMATNYSFEVLPKETRRTRFYVENFQQWMQNPSPTRIVIPTKGFSAKASLCLPEASEVEVATGPYFSGRIAVETAGEGDTSNCQVDGDPLSPRDTYTLRIDHHLCGSSVNRTAVETFILVQESLPILTHSTRRFLILCTFQPETLTVSAGLNLPHTSSGYTSPEVAESVNEVLDNNVHASALQIPDNMARSHADQVSEAQTVMLVVIVAVGLVAIGLTVWWFIPLKSSQSSRESVSSEYTTYTSDSSVYDNYENSIRDSEFDFETAQDVCEENVEENIFKEGVCNEIIQEACATFELTPVHASSVECTTHSEA